MAFVWVWKEDDEGRTLKDKALSVRQWLAMRIAPWLITAEQHSKGVVNYGRHVKEEADRELSRIKSDVRVGMTCELKQGARYIINIGDVHPEVADIVYARVHGMVAAAGAKAVVMIGPGDVDVNRVD